jgi:rSAM/selenodomain-associated transferase 1
MKNNLLMIFVKNPVLGTAKTRLAASVGDHKALEIYKFLLEHTAKIVQQTNDIDYRILYSTKVEQNDMFDNTVFQKTVQRQGELGEKMFTAFEQAFQDGYKHVSIIGSDCYELTPEIVSRSFATLQQSDFTIGPAKDGGYYLLGMNKPEPAVFQNKKWSSDRVFQDTIIDLEVLRYTYTLLPTLSDVDYLEDLPDNVREQFNV